MNQSAPFFVVASTTALLLVACLLSSSWSTVEASPSLSSTRTSSCRNPHIRQRSTQSAPFGVGVASRKKGLTASCKRSSLSSQEEVALTIMRMPRGGGIFQDPAVKNDFFGTPNTFVPPAYPMFDIAFMVGYAALIYAMPGSVGSLHKMIHIAWEVVHIVLVGITNYGVKAFFPNKPTLPLKLMYVFDASWTVFLALMPFILDQGSETWNLFWHIAGVVSLLSVPLLDFKADVRKSSE